MDKPAIRILKPGDEAALEAFLLPCIESSIFLLRNLRDYGLLDQGQRFQGTYAAAFEGEKIIGVVAHYRSHSLIFQSPLHLDLLCQAVIDASQRPIGGLIGPGEQIAVVEAFFKLPKLSIKLDEKEKLYSLKLDDLTIPNLLKSSRVEGRRIEPCDVELMTRWRVAYAIEALGDKDSPELWANCQNAVERSMKAGNTWVLEERGEPVACSLFNSAVKEAVQVGGVWTPPPLRGRGYGRCVVAASLLDARSEGVEKAVLFTGERNIAAPKAYTALGFLQIGGYRLLLLSCRVPNADFRLRSR